MPSGRISERTGRPILIRQGELDARAARGNVETIEEETTLQEPSAVSDKPIERRTEAIDDPGGDTPSRYTGGGGD